MRRRISLALGVAVLLMLTGCANSDLAEQFRAGTGKGYVAGNGTITEIPIDDRGAPITFTGELDSGATFASDEFAGSVMVVNFWYAGCAPCRAEAPDLQAVSEQFAGEDVQFVGVNVRDQPATARAFAETYGVTYPSILDANDAQAMLAFSGVVAPNAVPTTIVLDRQHRVASRILGQISARSILESLIESAMAEPA